MTKTAYEPSSEARGLLAHWHERWGSCERLSDVPVDRGGLSPWVDDLAIFELVDHGDDFRLREIGENLATLLGCHRNKANLSFQLPFRQRLRQILLRATMIRAPAVEYYDWLIDGLVRSCIVCAMPVAGGFHQPSQMLLSVLPRT